MKVAVIGGGSTYTPELVSGLSRERGLIEVDELALHDIDAERREVVGGLARRMLDAARVDGCGELRILTTVVIRLAKPGIAAVALFSMLYTFNDFFLPLLYTSENPSNWVLSIGLSEFRSLRQVQWNLTMAATLVVMAPVIIVFCLAQKAFVEGVTLTGVKG